MDKHNKWYEARVVEIKGLLSKSGNKNIRFKVHFWGYHEKHDEWLDLNYQVDSKPFIFTTNIDIIFRPKMRIK